MSAQRRASPAYAQTMRHLSRRIAGDGPGGEQLARWVAAITAVGIVAGAVMFFALYWVIQIPDPNADFETQRSNVYFADGEHKIGSFAMQDRENVPLDRIAEPMQSAVIAAEDRSFYRNRGIDLRGIVRAARNNASSGEITGGGSTITQQYVKVLYLSQERSYVRKLREAILSIKIHNRMSKQEILTGYLNLIYFGNGAYGVEVASQTYFDKPAADLDIAESAVLAAAINQPSAFDPYSEQGRQAVLPRYQYVLDGMADAGAITASQAAEVRDQLPEFSKKPEINRFGGPNGYLLEFVRSQMQKIGFPEQQIVGGGYDIVTTINYTRQAAAAKAMDTYGHSNLPDLNKALVSITPGDGAVRAMYGGDDYLKKSVNWATWPTQPGSTFKAFALVAALEDGFSLKTKLNGKSPLRVGVGPWAADIENQGDSGGQSFGHVNLKYATQKSINTAFVDLTMQLAGGEDSDITIGTQKIRDAANEAGIPTSITDKMDPAAAVTPLGYYPVPPIDMANAYATIAAGGLRADWYVVDHVMDPSGNEIYRHRVRTEQTIPSDVAGDALVALQGVTQAGTGVRARTFCPTAGKTGTATAQTGGTKNQHVSSSWFVGATPKLATAVMFNRGVGNEDLEGYLVPFFGGTFPAMTFKAYMDGALDRSDCGTFVEPGDIVNTKGDTQGEDDKDDEDDEDKKDKNDKNDKND